MTETKSPPAGLTYPCEFPLKIFIRPDEDVALRIAQLACDQLAAGAEVSRSSRLSSGGKYMALTLNFIADDAEQLDRVIKAVTADPGVILAL
jgi:putative lipoic acid-binding regulatory protein